MSDNASGPARQRALLVHHSISVGGGTLSLLDVIDMMRARFDITVAIPSPPPWLATRLAQLGARVRPIEHPFATFNHHNGGPAVISPAFWFHLLRSYRPWPGWEQLMSQFDLVVLNSSPLVPLARVARRAQVPVVLISRDTFDTGQWRSRVVLRRFDRDCDGVTFLSEYDLHNANLRRAHAAVVPDVLQADAWPRIAREQAAELLDISPDQINVLHLGGDRRMKAPEVILEAQRVLDRADVHLVYAGNPVVTGREARWWDVLRLADRRYRRRLAALVGTIPPDRISLVGALPDPSIAYCAADIVIFGAATPHQGRPIYEAGWYSLPAVAPDYDNLREWLTDGYNGFTHEPGNGASLARALRRLADDPELRAEMGRNNHTRTLAQRDIDRVGADLLALIDRVLTSY